MKYLLAILFLFAACSNPSEPEKRVSVKMFYDYLSPQFVPGYTIYYSTTARVTGSDGTVADLSNSQQAQFVSFKQGASLTATYQITTVNNTTSQQTVQTVTKTQTAVADLEWRI